MMMACKLCGSPIEFAAAELGHGPLAENIAQFIKTAGKNIICDSCYQSKVIPRFRAEDEDGRAASLADVLPSEFADTDLGHPKMNTQAALRALAWVFGKKGLLLCGPTGQAKSRCAYELLRRVHMAGKRCVQNSHGEWSMRCMDYSLAVAVVEDVKGCDLFLLDDLGKARLTTWNADSTRATELLFDVFDHRMKWHRPVIVTTNMHGAEFKAKWGEHGMAMARRLAEFCEVVKF